MEKGATLSNKEERQIVDDSQVLRDYALVQKSRQISLIGRKEVFMGKAKFGVFGDGKEVAQVVMAKYFRKGDFRSGYYRDQTLMFAIGESTFQEFFAQLYAHVDVKAEPASAGRLMNAHFGTRALDGEGNWENLMEMRNSTSDISPTAAQMPRLLGLAYASKLYKENQGLKDMEAFSKGGNEVAWGTIGNASTAEGVFLETVNAGGVLQVPMIISVWDDEYGISVPNKYHTTKGSISEALKGFQREKGTNGYEILEVKGWDYEGLISVYEKADKIAREEHVPVIIHVKDMTQPQGHSTSGSHERYKSKERLAWEAENDCILKLRNYIIDKEIATEEELDEMDRAGLEEVKKARELAWNAYLNDIRSELNEAVSLINEASLNSKEGAYLLQLSGELSKTLNPVRKDVISSVRKALLAMRFDPLEVQANLKSWYEDQQNLNSDRYNSHLYSESKYSASLVEEIPAEYKEDSPVVDGRQILQACFDNLLASDPRFFALGEDVGKIGDVNQGFAGLQAKYGKLRVTDTGIRESTIIGQGIGTALRGLRPVAEIQYLDYLLYTLQTLSDDLASLHYRTKGGQKAPLIVRTRGHRLEGVWHSGSPMSMILGSLRGMLVCVPRTMTQAAGMYNTLIKSDEPALIIETLNGYRLKERMPSNIGEFTVPLGKPEILREGTDLTLVTYGAMCSITMDAAEQLQGLGISMEVIDVQTLLPFDTYGIIGDSIKKTNRVIFADEDVPGGASAFMMQQVIEEQGAYKYLDSPPTTISAQAHRPAYSTDGDYFSKPSVDDIVEKAYEMMSEVDPSSFPAI